MSAEPAAPPPPPESEEQREARIRVEIARRELEMRMRAAPPPGREEGASGHAGKAGFRVTTTVLVVVAVLGALWVLTQASKKLDLREPRRPRGSQSWP